MSTDWWPFGSATELQARVPQAARGANAELFHDHARPELGRLMRALGLDVTYVQAEGDWMEYEAAGGYRRRVLDLLGGYGAGLFGHHHPVLVAALRQALDEKAPVQAQASVRAWAGEVAAGLGERIGRSTGRHYVVTLSNTGAEAVEAAIKHAELERYATGREEAKRFRRRIGSWVADADPDQGAFLREAARAFELPAGATVTQALHAVLAYNERERARPPVFFALERAFHGKTTSASQLTYNPDYRTPFARVGVQAEFLAPGDAEAWEWAIDRVTGKLYDVTLNGGRLALQERRWVNASAILVEAIQGEGGIHELGAEDAARIRRLADMHGIPVIVDEIQAGLGRSGEFLAATGCGLVGDYYVFAKSLGGGLTKIGALAVDAARYVPEFGVIHTSTFAEDDLSCRVAARALALIDEADVPGRCRRAGEHWLARLREQVAKHPSVLREARGRGLMLGLEFHTQGGNPSNVIRMLSDQGYLGYAIAGYLLHEEGFRVAPTLSAATTIRLEPSAFVDLGQLDNFVVALDRLCTAIERGNAYRLTRYLVGLAKPGDRDEIEDFRGAAAKLRREAPACEKRVAFIGHFISAKDALLWDPSLGRLPKGAVEHYQLAAHRVLGPTIYDQAHVVSAQGETVHLSFIGINLTSKSIEGAMRARDTGWIIELIEEAIVKAHEAGCQVVGLGGYTSIVTDNGRRLAAPLGVAITTGNSLTVAMGLESLRRGALQLGIVPGVATLGVVGAAGNIGTVYARMMAAEVPRLVLVGRSGGSRLQGLAATIYDEAFAALEAGTATGVGAAIADTQAVQALRAVPVDERGKVGDRLLEALTAELGERAPIQITSDPAALRECRLIVACSNSAAPVIQLEHLHAEPVVICDLSVPADVAPAVEAQRPDVLVMRGGLVAVPGDPEFRIGGIPLPAGHAFACMSETLIMGLRGTREHYSLGPVVPEKVRAAMGWAEGHGFRLGDYKTDRSF
ncbi:MAG: aminotransferase class-III [Cyanobacteria bacterium RYN_339]|nr:aminotransferase class-III [Cyanobacteria bacterium RYN_339]